MDKKKLIEKKIKYLSNLKIHLHKKPEEINDLAIRIVEEELRKHVDWVGLTEKEEILATKIYGNYIDHHHLEGYNDLEDLKTLVYNSMLENRIKEKIKDLTDGKEIPSKYTLDSLNNIQNQNLSLKTKLGLDESKQEGWLEFWKRLVKKIFKHAQENSGAFYFKCPGCGQMALLVKKVADYNIFDFKVFRGTYLYSKELCKMMDEKLIDAERAAKVLGCSPDYTRGCYEKIYLKDKYNEKKI